MALRTGSSQRRARRARTRVGVVLGGLGLALGGLGVIAASVLGVAAPAFAHNYLVSSTPKSGQTLTALPARFVVTTNEGLLDLSGHGSGFALQIRDAAGKYYGDGCVTVNGPAMSVTAQIGAAGKYTALWQVVSADGHVVSDDFPFTWAPSGSFTPSAAHATPQNCGGKSGGAAAATPTAASTPQNASLGIVLGVGGGVVGLGIVLTVILLLVGRRRKA
jgi:methionine-rich copper-binding protein CopC